MLEGGLFLGNYVAGGSIRFELQINVIGNGILCLYLAVISEKMEIVWTDQATYIINA